MICSLQVKCIIIINKYVDLFVTMDKIISSYKLKKAHMLIFCVGMKF